MGPEISTGKINQPRAVKPVVDFLLQQTIGFQVLGVVVVVVGLGVVVVGSGVDSFLVTVKPALRASFPDGPATPTNLEPTAV